MLNPPFTSMLSPGIPAQPLYALIGPYEGVGGNVNKRWLGVDDTSSKAKGRAAKVAKAKRKAANRKALAKLLSAFKSIVTGMQVTPWHAHAALHIMSRPIVAF